MSTVETAVRPRVVMVLESVFPPTRGGGAESQVETLARYFKGRGIDPLIVVPMVKEGPRTRREDVGGLEVVRIPYPRIRLLGGVVMLARLAWLLVRRRSEYAAIHAHIANNMAAVCCVVGRLLGKTVVVKLTGWHEMELGILADHRKDPVAGALRWALRRADHIQAISSRLESRLVACRFDAARIERIPNAVDTRRFRARRDGSGVRREHRLGDDVLGLFLGRLVPEKGLVPLLETWFRVFPDRSGLRILVVGAGAQEATLARMVADAGRSQQVVFAGARPAADVERFLAAADFGVLPSLHEGLSNALLEFMAVGLPVLGSRVSGTEDLVTPGETGWLFESGDRAGLEACLREIGTTPRERFLEMGRKAREAVGRYAGIDAVAERLAKLYGLGLAPLTAPSVGS